MRKRLFLRFIFFLTLLSITLLAVSPSDEVAAISFGWDKANHCIAFWVLALLFDQAFPQFPRLAVKLLILLGYGMLIELIQGLSGLREASWLDLLANAMGLLLYGFLQPVLQRCLVAIRV